MNYEQFNIKDYKYWTIQINENQYYLGRCTIWCKRNNVIDFFDMTNDELKEFFEIAKHLRNTLKRIFNPDLFNYASLCNETRHLHIHVVPRYKNSRMFLGKEFNDERWGMNYAGKEFKPDNRILFGIRDKIRKELK